MNTLLLLKNPLPCVVSTAPCQETSDMGKFSGVQVSMDGTGLVLCVRFPSAFLDGGAAETIKVHRDRHGPSSSQPLAFGSNRSAVVRSDLEALRSKLRRAFDPQGRDLEHHSSAAGLQNANTTAARTVVYPLCFTMLDWVMLRVLTIFPLIRKISFFSSQLSSALKSIPSVEASMAAARSSA